MDKLGSNYMAGIIRFYGVPIVIVSYKDSRFTYEFWASLQKVLDTKLDFSIAFHPRTDGAYYSDTGGYVANLCFRVEGSWNIYLPLMELAYNNNYQASIKRISYEVLYGRKCKIPVC